MFSLLFMCQSFGLYSLFFNKLFFLIQAKTKLLGAGQDVGDIANLLDEGDEDLLF